MATLQKQFADGGTLYVEYSGEGNGNATFTADTNDSIDREVSVVFTAADCDTITRRVWQEGKREVFDASDGDFLLADGGTFNVIKEKYYV